MKYLAIVSTIALAMATVHADPGYAAPAYAAATYAASSYAAPTYAASSYAAPAYAPKVWAAPAPRVYAAPKIYAAPTVVKTVLPAVAPVAIVKKVQPLAIPAPAPVVYSKPLITKPLLWSAGLDWNEKSYY